MLLGDMKNIKKEVVVLKGNKDKEKTEKSCPIWALRLADIKSVADRPVREHPKMIKKLPFTTYQGSS